MVSERDPFYVGYLPLPAAIRRFIVPWLVGNLVLAIGIAAVVAQQHREPGDGVWETGSVIWFDGLLQQHPYPILHVSAEDSYLLVEQGKVGVQERLRSIPEAATAGELASVNVKGFLIERDGRKVLELDGSDPYAIVFKNGLPPFGKRQASHTNWPSQLETLDTHTLRGEIVDPKCYLGVMQPGDGKTHKVCATLCIKGGIPPMLLVRDKTGKTAAYLLTDADGNAFPESHYEYIADPIEITGQVLRDGDLLILRADLESIKRLE